MSAGKYDYSYIAGKLSEFKLSSRLDLETGCWVWQGAKGPKGYGHFCFKGQQRRAHRVALWFAGREIPDGLEPDHTCRNRGCVNPDHLEIVTHAENVRRGISGEVNGARNRAKTHCPNGHPYEGDNLIIIKRKDGRQERNCKQCRSDHRRRWRGLIGYSKISTDHTLNL